MFLNENRVAKTRDAKATKIYLIIDGSDDEKKLFDPLFNHLKKYQTHWESSELYISLEDMSSVFFESYDKLPEPGQEKIEEYKKMLDEMPFTLSTGDLSIWSASDKKILTEYLDNLKKRQSDSEYPSKI